MSVPGICRSIPGDMSLERYARRFQDEGCPEAYVIEAYMGGGGISMFYDEETVKDLATGPVASLISDLRARTNNFRQPTDLTRSISFLCNDVPGLCDHALIENCAQAQVPPGDDLPETFIRLCGCFHQFDRELRTLPLVLHRFPGSGDVRLPDPCESTCDIGDTVQRQDATTPWRLDRCRRPICSISPITIRNIDSNIGNVHVTDICRQCNVENQCICYFNPATLDVDGREQMNALYRDALKSSACTEIDCLGDCGPVTNNASDSYLWILVLLAVVLVGTGLMLALFG